MNLNFLMTWIKMTTKYGNYCSSCQGRIYKGSEIFWNNDGSSKVKHYKMSIRTEQFIYISAKSPENFMEIHSLANIS